MIIWVIHVWSLEILAGKFEDESSKLVYMQIARILVNRSTANNTHLFTFIICF